MPYMPNKLCSCSKVHLTSSILTSVDYHNNWAIFKRDIIGRSIQKKYSHLVKTPLLGMCAKSSFSCSLNTLLHSDAFK